MFKLYDAKGKAHKVNFLIDKEEALASGDYYEVDPTKKKSDLNDEEKELIASRDKTVSDEALPPSRRTSRRNVEQPVEDKE